MDTFGHWSQFGFSLLIFGGLGFCAARRAFAGPRRELHFYLPATLVAGISLATYFLPRPLPSPWTPAVFLRLLHFPGVFFLALLVCAVYAVGALVMLRREERAKRRAI